MLLLLSIMLSPSAFLGVTPLRVPFLMTCFNSIVDYLLLRVRFTVEGSLEVKLPTIWTDGNCRGAKSPGGEDKK